MEFFAAADDQRALLRFLFAETDVRVMELASRPDEELRSFASVEAIDAAFRLGRGKRDTLLTLWSKAAMPRLNIRRIDFDPKYVKNARCRYEPEGAGLMQLYLGAAFEGVLTVSHFGHNSQARARKWNIDVGVRWQELTRLSRKIQHHVRKIAVARVPGRPVLAAAKTLWDEGYLLKENRQAPFHWQPAGAVQDDAPRRKQARPASR